MGGDGDASDYPGAHEPAPEREAADLRLRDHSAENPRVWDPVATPSPRCPTTGSEPVLLRPHAAAPTGGSSSSAATMTPTSASRTPTIFDPATETWSDVQEMTYARWYPTRDEAPRRANARRLRRDQLPRLRAPGRGAQRHRGAPRDLRPCDEHVVGALGREPPSTALPAHVRPARRAGLRRDDGRRSRSRAAC